MKKFLAVGLNHFQSPGNDLQECVADSRTYQSVAATLGITADVLTDSNANKRNVMAWLTEAVNEAKAGKLSYLGFAWSGHGTHFGSGANLQEAIVCYNLTELNGDWNPDGLITAKEFQSVFNQVPQSVRSECWLDVCFSAGLTKIMQKPSDPHPKSIHNPGNTTGQFRMVNPTNQMHKLHSNIVVWCASSQDQESADAPNLGNGAGTYTWAKVWKDHKKASRVDLIVAQRALIKSLGFDQTPRLSAWGGAEQLSVGS